MSVSDQVQVVKPESETKIAAMFDKIAPTYDFLNRLTSAGQDLRWRKALVAAIPFKSNLKLLDVATGTGDVLIAARRVHKDAQITGVDISQEMLRLAVPKLRAKQIPVNDQTLQVMSMEKLHFPDQSYDAVTISFGLRNVVDKQAGIREAYRVLKAGGTFLILEFFMPKPGLLSKLFKFYFHRILPLIASIWSDKSAYSYLPASVEGFYSLPELKQILTETGFAKIRQRSFLMGGVKLLAASKP